MNSVSAYIKRNELLSTFDFVIVYSTIIELIKDGEVVMDDVQVFQQQPEKE